MTLRKETDLTLEKLKIDERLRTIEAYIIEGKLLRIQIKEILEANGARLVALEENVAGKGQIRGIKDRVTELEKLEDGRKKVKDSFLKVAVGSITLAVGSFVLWLCRLIWSSMGK